VWGTLDEIHQAWIPGRSMEMGDALTDTVAGFVGALVATRRRLGATYSASPSR
jgi:VanZ family protein